MIVDSHCHLDYPVLYNQLDEVIKRARSNDVEYMLTICTTINSFDRIKLIIKKYINIYGTFGIHPHESNKHTNVDKEFILKIKREYDKVIGIGETGLDYYYNHSSKEIQKNSLINHIHAASELDIPLIVHSRSAEIDTYDILKSEKKNCNLKILMHCFTGSKDFAKKLIDLNSYISISGIVTFKNSSELEDVVSFIPLKNLLIETDAPYLAPAPHRGESNEPSFIVHTLEKISKIKTLPIVQIKKNTTENFKKLFNLK